MKAFPLVFVFFVNVLFTSLFAANQDVLKAQMARDLDMIQNCFEVNYAPVEWKKNYANWILHEQIANAKDKINSEKTINLKKYQQIVKSFFNSTRDYHAGVFFYATEASFLPFRIQGAQGRYFISWVDKSACPPELSIGDELIEFDGKPTHDVLTAFKKQEFGNLDSLTDQKLAENLLSVRLGALGFAVMQGPLAIKVVHLKSGKKQAYVLNWSYIPEEVSEGPHRTAMMMGVNLLDPSHSNQFSIVQPRDELFSKFMQPGFIEHYRKAYQRKIEAEQRDFDYSDNHEGDPQFIEGKQGYLPPIGPLLWELPEDRSYRAYIFKSPKGKTIGYVRLPHYIGNNETAKDFADIIKIFESNTDALVIDQLNNAGGNVLYMYALASMLADEPIPLHPHRIAINQEDVASSLFQIASLKQIDLNNPNSIAQAGFGTFYYGYPVTAELLKSFLNYAHCIVNEWNQGNVFTAPTYLFGMDTLRAHPLACYTKPVLVLINSLSFSCGDFFPAILQDSKRATIMGTRSAGAGGFVISRNHPNRLGIAGYTVTGSIAERFDKQPIENIGVTPDIIYEPTVEDLQTNYSGFVAAVKNEIDELISKAPIKGGGKPKPKPLPLPRPKPK